MDRGHGREPVGGGVRSFLTVSSTTMSPVQMGRNVKVIGRSTSHLPDWDSVVMDFCSGLEASRRQTRIGS